MVWTNEILLGALGRAQQLYRVGICAFAFVSNHFHLLLRVESTRQLALFMGHFNSNLAREAGRLVRWREKFWGRRYQAIPVSDEEGAQVERLRYVLAHGCKEDLVERLRDWPGVSAVRAILDGEPLEGLWFDRSQEHLARRQGKAFARLEFATSYTVQLESLLLGAPTGRGVSTACRGGGRGHREPGSPKARAAGPACSRCRRDPRAGASYCAAGGIDFDPSSGQRIKNPSTQTRSS